MRESIGYNRRAHVSHHFSQACFAKLVERPYDLLFVPRRCINGFIVCITPNEAEQLVVWQSVLEIDYDDSDIDWSRVNLFDSFFD